MECLGINQDEGSIYEGRIRIGFRTQPQPLLLPISFIGAPTSSTWPEFVDGHPSTIFREDSFDPVTRIRRGRVFTLYGNSATRPWTVHDPLRDDLTNTTYGNGVAKEIVVRFYSRDLLDGFSKTNRPNCRPIAAIGTAPYLSLWTVLSIETSAHGTPILTLKAQRSFGILPKLHEPSLPPEIHVKLTAALEKVEESMNRLGAEAVIDRCRDSMAILFSHKLGDHATDLGDALKKVEHLKTKPSDLAIWAGRICARLHSRAKPNEQEKHGTPSVTEDDALLAVQCLGLALREFGWARPY